ncbi:threonine/serine ThrE exporter family protein [Aestuariimicrobium soli]|uniref:threonine/serine ThrE exporter family protein n=1 Tax=Aestuariimicrobium soli TaxID=2035834 RepID=UPI003EB7699D
MDWRERARAAWKASRETSTTLTGEESLKELEARQARIVLDVATRLASLSLGAGASAADATALALLVADHYGVPSHVDVTFTSVTMTHQRGFDEDPISLLRTVRTRATDYQRLARLEGIGQDIAAGRLELMAAREAVVAEARSPRTYRGWLVTTATGVLGGAVALLIGANLGEIVFAALVCAVIERVQWLVARTRMPGFFQQISGAAVLGLVAILIMVGRATPAVPLSVSPSMVVSAGMVAMLSGLALMTAARDAIDGYYVTSGARMIEVLLQTGGIIFGLLTTLWIGLRFGVPAYLTPQVGGITPLMVQVPAAMLISLSFAVSSHLGPRSLPLSAGLGALGVVVSGLLVHQIGTAAAAGLGAFAVSFVAQLGTRRWRIPQLALLSAGVVSLLPGMITYRGLLATVQLDQGQTVLASESPRLLLTAVLTAVWLAAGSAFGAMVARPFGLPANAQERRSLMKAWRRNTPETPPTR